VIMGFFLLEICIRRGVFNKMILGGIYQYLVKIEVFFNIPQIHVLCHRFIKWRPYGWHLHFNTSLNTCNPYLAKKININSI
jgi:hypothetical protein